MGVVTIRWWPNRRQIHGFGLVRIQFADHALFRERDRSTAPASGASKKPIGGGPGRDFLHVDDLSLVIGVAFEAGKEGRRVKRFHIPLYRLWRQHFFQHFGNVFSCQPAHNKIRQVCVALLVRIIKNILDVFSEECCRPNVVSLVPTIVVGHRDVAISIGFFDNSGGAYCSNSSQTE